MRKPENLLLSCAVVTKFGSLNFLEPSGPVQVCNGTALPFFFYYCHPHHHHHSLGFFGFCNLRVYLCCLCNWPVGSQTSMYINKGLNIIIALLYFCVQLITSAHILCTLTFSDIRSNFRSVALPKLHTAWPASATRVTPVAH